MKVKFLEKNNFKELHLKAKNMNQSHIKPDPRGEACDNVKRKSDTVKCCGARFGIDATGNSPFLNPKRRAFIITIIYKG
jgi:hypothetical protein